LFRVKNADNLEDARAVVLAELDGVRSLVIAPRP
jgi:predicted transcriptional regulator